VAHAQTAARHLAPTRFTFACFAASLAESVRVLHTASVNMRRSSSLVLGRARTVDARGFDACQFVMAYIWGLAAEFKPLRARVPKETAILDRS
jgi:hypothetical protein